MYGKYFKELRQKRNLSIRQVATDVVSPSTLSRWENDEITPNFNIIVKLLQQIHVSPYEFINYAHIQSYSLEIVKMNEAYFKKDIITLKLLFNDFFQQYKQKANPHNLFIAGIASSFYFELTKTKLLPQLYINKLAAYLSSVTYWSHYYLGIFGNTIPLLSDRLVFGLTNLIINDLEEIKDSGLELTLVAWTTILNFLAILLKDQSPFVKKLYKRIKNLSISSSLVSIRFRKKFLEALFRYQINQTGEESIYNMIEATKILGLEEYYSDFYSLFVEIQTKLNH